MLCVLTFNIYQHKWNMCLSYLLLVPFQTTKLLYDCGFGVDISFSKMLWYYAKKSFCKHSSGNGSWRNNFGLKAAFFINKNVRGHCNESIVFLVNRIYVYASQYWMEPITKISSVTHDPLSYMCWSRIILCSALIWLFHFFDFRRAVEVLAPPFCK